MRLLDTLALLSTSALLLTACQPDDETVPGGAPEPNQICDLDPEQHTLTCGSETVDLQTCTITPGEEGTPATLTCGEGTQIPLVDGATGEHGEVGMAGGPGEDGAVGEDGMTGLAGAELLVSTTTLEPGDMTCPEGGTQTTFELDGQPETQTTLVTCNPAPEIPACQPGHAYSAGLGACEPVTTVVLQGVLLEHTSADQLGADLWPDMLAPVTLADATGQIDQATPCTVSLSYPEGVIDVGYTPPGMDMNGQATPSSASFDLALDTTSALAIGIGQAPRTEWSTAAGAPMELTWRRVDVFDFQGDPTVLVSDSIQVTARPGPMADPEFELVLSGQDADLESFTTFAADHTPTPGVWLAALDTVGAPDETSDPASWPARFGVRAAGAHYSCAITQIQFGGYTR